MNYFKFYNILKLSVLTKKNVGFLIILLILSFVQVQLFFSESNSIELDYSFLFLVTIVIISLYAHQIRFNPAHPIYQFPISSKQRVRYDYIGVFFMFITIVVGFALFGFLVVGLFYIFDPNIENIASEEFFSFFGTIYQIGYLFTIMGIIMPLSYVASSKYKVIIVMISFTILILFNFVVTWLLSGEVFAFTNIKVLIENSSYGYMISISLLVFSVLAMYQSYKISLKLNSYQ